MSLSSLITDPRSHSHNRASSSSVPGTLELESSIPKVCWGFISAFGIRNQYQSSQDIFARHWQWWLWQRCECGGREAHPAARLRLPIILVGLTPLQRWVLGEPLLRQLISSLQHWEAVGSNKVSWCEPTDCMGERKNCCILSGGEMEPRWSYDLTTVRAEPYGAASILQSQKLKWDRGKGFFPSASSCPHGCPHA